jgi:hypothetical protein
MRSNATANATANATERRQARRLAHETLLRLSAKWDGRRSLHQEDRGMMRPSVVRDLLHQIAQRILSGEPEKGSNCCAYEQRSRNGGCLNCDDPCF